MADWIPSIVASSTWNVAVGDAARRNTGVITATRAGFKTRTATLFRVAVLKRMIARRATLRRKTCVARRGISSEHHAHAELPLARNVRVARVGQRLAKR